MARVRSTEKVGSVDDRQGPASDARPKLAVAVASDLRRRILDGSLSVGTSLTEAELTHEFDVSRPTLREALRILEMEQLLSVRRGSHRGSIVRLPDSSITVRSLTMLLHLRGASMLDIYDARAMFEPTAARCAAERATPDQIAGLRRVLDDGIVAMRANELLYPTVGWRFHTAVVTASGNATLTVLAEAFEHISEHHTLNVVTGWAENCGQLVRRAERAHRKLIDLIEQREGERAETYWRKHMHIVRGLLFGTSDNESIVEMLD